MHTHPILTYPDGTVIIYSRGVNGPDDRPTADNYTDDRFRSPDGLNAVDYLPCDSLAEAAAAISG